VLPALPSAALPAGINTCTIGPDGDCQLEDLLVGEGSFGTVRMGYYYDDPVAVKLMRTSFGANPSAEQRKLLKEVQLQVGARVGWCGKGQQGEGGCWRVWMRVLGYMQHCAANERCQCACEHAQTCACLPAMLLRCWLC
jgi:hypothetical protein